MYEPDSEHESNWSVPETEVLHSVEQLLERGERGVLATIIGVEGSAYRRPGAKMVVPEGDEGVGHITAGCLEDEIQQLASEVLAVGEPRIETYDLRPETDEDVWGLGVGCNGVIDILLEPIDESYRPVVEAVREDRSVCVLTVVNVDDEDETQVGARAYYDPIDDAFTVGEHFPADLSDRIHEAAANLADRGRAETVSLDGTSVFVDGIAAPMDLVVFGTGHDVAPIVEVGKQSGFQVIVVGFRSGNVTPKRFPAADAVLSTSPGRLREDLDVDLDDDTYAVIATHNFVDDRLTVDELLQTNIPYIGLLGPRERFETMLEDFQAEDRTFDDSELERLYTPVGLDLGGGTPHQIAVSVISEVLAVSNDREPGHLRDREGRIHDRTDLAADGGD